MLHARMPAVRHLREARSPSQPKTAYEEIADHERRHEPPRLLVVIDEIFLQRSQHRREDKTIEGIEQIEAGEDAKKPGRRMSHARVGICHRWQS